MKNVSIQYASEKVCTYTSAFVKTKEKANLFKKWFSIALLICSLSPLQTIAQCTGCGQSTTTNTMPSTNNFSNTFCITTGSTLTYNQGFDMNGGTVCIGTGVTFSSGGGNYNGNWTINNYGTTTRSITLNTGQTFNNYGTFTGSITLNGGTVVNYNGATFTPSSFTFNGGSFTNNLGGTATIGASVTVNSTATFINYGTLSVNGLTLNSSASATLGGTTTVNGSVSNNGTITVAGLLTVTSNFNQNSSGVTTSATGGQCNALNVSGTIQGQGNYNGVNGLVLNKALSPACGACLTNGAIVTTAPANQITGATLTSSGNNINGTITNPGGSPAATHYIVLRRIGGNVTDQPTDFVTYSVGSIIGSSTVVAVNPISTLTFTDANVITANGCGSYRYAVFPLNSNGTCGVYNRTVNATNRSSITIASVAGSVGTSTSICPGGNSGTLTLTGHTGSVVRWESSVSPFSSWTTISNTATTYTSGALSQTTQFRAVVNAGSGCSNVNSTAATITVSDNTAPIISSCPGNQTVNLNSSCTATMPNYTSLVTVSDNCTATGSIIITQSPAAGSTISGSDVQIVTMTATDGSGNSSNCTFNLTKQDVTAPVISCPSNITTNAATGTCGAAVTYSVTATDNCSGCAPASITGYTLIGTYNGHTYFRSTAGATWAAANSAAGALGAHLVTITSAGENSFLAAQPTSWTGFTDQAVEGTWAWVTGEAVTYTNWNTGEPNNSGGDEDYMQINWSGNYWNDNNGATSLPYIIEYECTGITMNLVSGYASGSTFPVGTTTVTYNATDGAGNTSANCSFTVTVNDVTPPMLTCPANINVNTAAGACDAVVTYATPIASDNCGSCSSAPAITGYTSLGIYNGNAYYISNTNATAAQGIANAATLGANMAAISSAGENTFIRNAATAAGFTGNYLIGFNDVATEGSFVWSSGEAVIYTNWSGGEPNNSGDEDYVQVYASGLWNDIGATSSSPYVIEIACVTPVRTSGLASGSTFPLGTSTINYSATDPSGNTSTCSFTVTVSLNPSSTGKTVSAATATICAGTSTNITVAASDNGISYQLRDNATNINIGSPVTGTGGTINLPTGNLSATTTFNVYATGTGCSYQLTNTATVTVNTAATVTPGSSASVCQSASPVAITLSGASVGGGASTGAWSITAGGGTLSSTAQTGTPATVTYTPAANYSGTVTLTLTTNDPAGPCGVVSATRTITVTALPTNLTPSAAASSVCSGSGTNIQIASSQSGVNYQLRNNSGNVNIGSAVAGTGGTINLPTGNLTSATTFNVLATDATSGCNRQLTTTVTVTMDNTAPVITCPATQNLSLNSSCTATLPSYTSLATVSDNCTATGSIVVTQSPVAGTSVSGVGTQTVTLTATDAAGNSSTCTFTVNKQDVTPPVISCPSNITVNATSGICGAVVNYTVTATDNCTGASCAPASISGYTLIGTYNGHTYFRSNTSALWPTAKTSAEALGAHLVTISSAGENAFLSGIGTHWAGFTDEVTEGTWLWVTGEPVVYTSWAAGEPNNGGNQDYMVLNYSGTNWDDQGTTTTVSQPYVIEFDCLTTNLVSGLASGSVFPVGTTTVTYNSTDQAGNTSANCSFTVTVTDVTPPTILCPANISVNASAGTCAAIVNYTTPVASDNCGSCSSAPAISGYASLGVYNGNAYYISTGTANCTTAFSTAATLGASVATIGSAAENTFIRNAANTAGYTGSYLIGANDAAVEGTFVGFSGETLPYTNWSAGEPNNSGDEDYTQVLNNGYWNDINVGTVTNYIIKMSCITPTRTSGLASGSSFPLGTSTVNYSATDASGNTASCSFTVTVSNNPTSTGRAVAAATNPVCYGTGTNITVALSDNGVSFQLRDNATNANIGSPVTGTGATINLPTGNLTANTTFNVYATPPSCAGYQLTNTVTVTINPVATVTPGSTLSTCQSATPTAVTLSGASVGGSASTGAWSITAGGGTLSSTAQTATPATVTYTPAANYSGTVTLTLTTNDPAGPCGAVSATRTITVNALPVNKTLSAAASNVCPGTGTNIQVAASQAGVNYQLRNNTGNTLVGTAVVGTGGTINLPTGNLSAATTFNVLATDATTTCSIQMTSTVTVSMDNTAPVITCPATQTINLNSSCQTTMPSYTSLATVSDNCTASGSITVTQSPAAGTTISGSGTQVITLTATDATGNSSTCTFNLTKQDGTAPTISCPSNITASTAVGTCTAVVNYYVAATDACPSCPQGPVTGYTLIGSYGGHVYYRSNTSSTWATAKTNAEAVGAHLVTISSAAENTFLGGFANHWGGMTDEAVEGTWVWVTGEPASYLSWASGEPNNSGNQDYLVLNWNGTNWDDQGAAVSLPSIIEFECVTLNMVSGLASGSAFPIGTTTVTYNATDGAGNTSANCSFTVTVSLNSSSTGKTVSATTNPVCANNGTNVTVALSESGVSYQLRDNTTNASIGSAVTGTGGTINLPTGNLTTTTTFNILATPPSCTGYQLTNTITVTVNPVATVTPGSTLSACQSASPSAITLSGASVGGSATTGAWSITAGGGTLSSTAQTATPATVTYTPAANYTGIVTLTLTSDDPSGPCGAVSATRTITVNALPTNLTPSAASASVCSGTGTNVQIASSQSGVNYQLRNNTGNVNIGSAVAGTGGTINLPTGNLTSATTFNVLATDASTGCNRQLTTTVTVSISATPTNITPTAAASAVCSGNATNIQVPTSQSGVNYQLRNNTGNVNIGSAVAGTGGTISLPTGTLSAATTFNVLATNTTSGCSVQMTNTVTVTINSAGQWVGGTSGNWNTASNWCGGVPTSTTNVNIPAGSTVNIQSANAVANSVTIAGTGSLVMTGAYNLSISAGGTFTNNGTFTATSSTGTVAFLGNGTISGTTTFNNIDAYGALNFGTASTIAGAFSIQTGGSVTGNSPTYVCPTSILRYSPGSTFSRGLEWTTASSGAGYPANVQVQNNTTINFPATGNGYICYDLQIDAGSSLRQDYSGGSASLNVGRNITISGTLSLGSTTGGNISLGGNWVRNTGGVFNANDRMVTFNGPSNFSGNGTSMSTITAPASAAKDNEGGFGGEKFAHIWIDKTAATDSVVLLSNITVTNELGLTRGTFSLRNSDVTIVSNETRTADVAPITNTANVNVRYAGTGKFVIQRFIHNPTNVRAWRLLGVPLQSATAPTINEAWQEGVVNPDRANPDASGGIYNPWPGYGTHITGPGGTYNATNGWDQGTNSASVLYVGNGLSSWTAPANTTTTKITDKQGWMLFVRGSRSFAIGNQYVPSQNTILEPKGRINIGNVVIPVVQGKQVIANPYPSAISLLSTDVAGVSGGNSTYYMWDPKFHTSYTQPGKWVSFTGVGSSFVHTSSQSAYTSNGAIESGQAFVLEAANTGNLTFHESDKLPLTSSLVGITSGTVSRPMTQPNFGMFRTDMLVASNGNYLLTDGVLNLFGEGFDNATTSEDATKLLTFNTKESMSILRDTVKLAIEKRSDIIATDTIFLRMSRLNELPYRFRFAVDNFEPGVEAFLEDNFTQIVTPVNMTDTTWIDFSITADSMSKAENRFRVVFRRNLVVLPVTITSISAIKDNNSVLVNWNVEQQVNMSNYEVERSADGIHFSKLGQRPATEATGYNFTDVNPLNGMNYYRIKMIGRSNDFKYSSVAFVRMDKRAGITVYPNPVENNTVQLMMTGQEKGSYKLNIYSSNGQLIHNSEFDFSGTDAMKAIKISKVLPKGIYNAEVVLPSGKNTTIQIAVQ